MLPQQSFLHKAAFLKHTGRRRVVRDDMGDDLHQAELLKGILAHTLNNGGHDASAPERLCQPVPDLCPVGFADLNVIQAAAADQGIVACPNGKMGGLAVLIGGLGDTSEKCFGVGGVGLAKAGNSAPSRHGVFRNR